MQSESFFQFLKSLSSAEYPNEVTFLSTIIPQFICALGYSSTHLFFERDVRIGSERRLRVDAVIAENRGSRPWLVIEAKLARGNMTRHLSEWIHQLKTYHLAINSEYSVLLSPELLIILHSKSSRQIQIEQYFLNTLTLEEAEKIYRLLARPDRLPVESAEKTVPASSRLIDTDTFKLDLDCYSRLLKYVFTAETNDEKKESLEQLAKTLLEAIPFLSCKYSNLRTVSSEIDLVIQYNGSNGITFFDELGHYCLVECKNWKVSVGAAQVRDFIGKLQKSRIKLGVIFAKNGISGEHGGADAVREIHAAFDTFGLYVLVISEEDLRAIELGANFYEILDNKIDHLRFDI